MVLLNAESVRPVEVESAHIILEENLRRLLLCVCVFCAVLAGLTYELETCITSLVDAGMGSGSSGPYGARTERDDGLNRYLYANLCISCGARPCHK